MRCCVASFHLGFLVPYSVADDLAPLASYEGKPIVELRFDPPSQPVARPDLHRLLPFPPGTPLHLAEVRDAIKRLFATGEYSNIEFDAEPAPGGVVLTVRTTEQWFVGPVEVHGKVKLPPSEGQLANAARLELGVPFNEEDLQAAEKGITTYCSATGFTGPRSNLKSTAISSTSRFRSPFMSIPASARAFRARHDWRHAHPA